MKRCAACGTEADDWRPFCTRCGASYSGAAAEPVLGAAPPGAPPAPPVPGAPPPPRPSGEHKRPNAKVVASLVTVAIVAAAVGVLAATSGSKKAGAPTTTFPSTWDPRVVGLTQFDAKQRHLDYEHPVKVEFLSKAAFKKRVTGDASKSTAKDRREAENAIEELRAMGMVQGKHDLIKQMGQLDGASIEAYYDPHTKVVVVPGQTLDANERVILAHELTHTLDDQHFDMNKLDRIGEQHGTDAIDALEEGDAVTVQNAYAATLSPADKREYENAQDAGSSAGGDLTDIPKVLAVLQQWPYDFGPEFVAQLKDVGGQARVNEAFRSPPLNQEAVIDPVTYFDGDTAAPISAPKLPAGAKKLDGGKEFGALQWFLVLSERIDPHVALKAALGWGNDSYTGAKEGSRTCLEVHYRGETKRDNAEMLGALHQWIAALPKGMATVKANADNTLSLHSCDPGENAKVVTDRSVTAYQLLVFRDALITEFMKAGATPTLATCASDAITAQSSAAGVAHGQAPAVLSNPDAVRSIATNCRATGGTAPPSPEIDN